MKAEDIKNSILQLAIQGKLVKQNPNDEPAAILLKKIQAEKDQLINDKKIKKEKPLDPIKDEEKPFKIPDSWEWMRLDDVCSEILVPMRDKPKDFSGNIPWCRIEDIRGKYLKGTYSNKYVSQNTISKMNLKVNPVGTVISANSASIGTVAITTVQCCTNQTFIGLVCSCGLYNEYLYYYLKASVSKLRKLGTGTTILYISKDKYKNFLIPLPPLEEQKRIVAKIEEISLKIEQYDKAETELSKIEKSFPDDMKKSILQYAIQGKLVKQNPDDEPAAILLEKIQKENPLAPIRDEEKPFEIPDSWEWVRLGDISNFLNGYAYKSNTYIDESNNQIIRLGNVKNDKIELTNNPIYISDQLAEQTNNYKLTENNILVTMTGTRGKRDYFYTAVVEEKRLYGTNIYLNQRVGCLKVSININAKLVNLFLKSEYILRQIFLSETGTANQGNISSQSIKNLIMPLPPLVEQKRIVAKIEELFKYLDNIPK